MKTMMACQDDCLIRPTKNSSIRKMDCKHRNQAAETNSTEPHIAERTEGERGTWRSRPRSPAGRQEVDHAEDGFGERVLVNQNF
jgi:hypothetical protein